MTADTALNIGRILLHAKTAFQKTWRSSYFLAAFGTHTAVSRQSSKIKAGGNIVPPAFVGEPAPNKRPARSSESMGASMRGYRSDSRMTSRLAGPSSFTFTGSSIIMAAGESSCELHRFPLADAL
jgi:hypothetical protein